MWNPWAPPPLRPVVQECHPQTTREQWSPASRQEDNWDPSKESLQEIRSLKDMLRLTLMRWRVASNQWYNYRRIERKAPHHMPTSHNTQDRSGRDSALGIVPRQIGGYQTQTFLVYNNGCSPFVQSWCNFPLVWKSIHLKKWKSGSCKWCTARIVIVCLVSLLPVPRCFNKCLWH